jgi:PEP-CTERM motif-containing protein
MPKILLCCLIAVVGATRCLEASPITYAVLVDTSSIAGVSGNVDFQFNPGALITDPAFVTISMFVSDGTLAGVPVRLGDVTGTLPDVTIRNTTAFNDYTDGFTFGSFLSFRVRFDGTALTTPSPIATSGSTFAFSLFNSDFSSALLTSDAVNGALVQGDVKLDGTVTITNFGTDTTTVVEVQSGTPVPEPGTLLLVGAGLVVIARRSLRSRST